eukprot:gene27372-biopygen10419
MGDTDGHIISELTPTAEESRSNATEAEVQLAL